MQASISYIYIYIKIIKTKFYDLSSIKINSGKQGVFGNHELILEAYHNNTIS